MSLGRLFRSLAPALLVASLALPSAARDLIGVQDATFVWAPAGGPISGYMVYVSRNGSAPEAVEFVESTTATLSDISYGDEVEVSVRGAGPGQNGEYTLGPFSPASLAVNFVAPPQLGDHGTLVLHCPSCQTIRFRQTSDGSVTSEVPSLPTEWNVASSGDYDGNGETDLLWHNPSGGGVLMSLLENETPVGGAAGADLSLLNSRIVGSADFDRDGSAEMVLAALGGTRARLWALGNNEAVQVADLTGPDGGQLLGVGDYSGDGQPDLLWLRGASSGGGTGNGTGGGPPAEFSNPLSAWLNIWLGLFQRLLSSGPFALWLPAPSDPPTTPNDTPSQPGPSGPGLEIAVTDGTAVSSLLAVGPEVPAGWTLVGTGDYDGNRRPDVLWRDDRGALTVWYLSDGGFVGSDALPRQTGDEYRDVVASHDLLGGPGDEIVLQDRYTGRIVLVDPASNSLATRVVFADPGTDWKVVAVLD